MSRSSYTINALHADAICIIDNDVGLSVTNDAEAVVRELLRSYGGKRFFFYKDTEGRWDELVHNSIVFTGFAPISPEDMDKYNLVNSD